MLLSDNSSSPTLKICDFGFARPVAPQMHSILGILRQKTGITISLGSPLYMAPEILLGQSYSSKSDLWSVGCIYYEMLFGCTPLKPNSMEHLKRMASDHLKIVIPSSASKLCVNLLVSDFACHSNFPRTGSSKRTVRDASIGSNF